MLFNLAAAGMIFIDQPVRSYHFEAASISLTHACNTLNCSMFGCGRDGGYPPPPAQIRTCRITAYGSCLRYVTRRSAPQDEDACCGRGDETIGNAAEPVPQVVDVADFDASVHVAKCDVFHCAYLPDDTDFPVQRDR